MRQLLVFLLTLTCAPFLYSQTNKIPDGLVVIRSQQSGRCLDADVNSKTVALFGYVSKANQQWTFKNVDGNVYEIVNNATGTSLALERDATPLPDALGITVASNRGSTHWIVTALDDGSFIIASELDHTRCLDADAGHIKDDGTRVSLWGWVHKANQRWTINPGH